MALQPVNRRTVTDDVYSQIVADVLSGELRPGDSLPSERRLADVLGVSRPAVREALQKVAAAGLVDVRQGDSTTVRDFRRGGGLDLLPRLLLRGGELDPKTVRSILEARLHIGPKVAALAAERAGNSLATQLDDAIAALAATDDPIDRQRRAVDYWDEVVDGADSIVFRLLYNTLRAASELALPALATLMANEVGRIDAYRALAAAITDADPDASGEAARDLLEPATTAFMSALDTLEVQP